MSCGAGHSAELSSVITDSHMDVRDAEFLGLEQMRVWSWCWLRATLATPMGAACAALMVRVILALRLGTMANPQSFETECLIRNWFHGQGYTFGFLGTTYRSFHCTLPYDALYGIVYGLSGGNPTANLLVQWVCGALLCLAIAAIGRRLGGPPVAAIGAWIAALHPGLVMYDATRLVQFNFDALMIACGVLAFIRWAERPSYGRAAWAGMLTAVLMYERGTMGLFFPAGLIWVQRVGRVSWRRWVSQCVLYGVVAVGLIVPWLIRNAVVHHRFVPMMTTTAMALWTGNNDAATGTPHAVDTQPLQALTSPAMQNALHGATTELTQMDALHEAAMRFIREHPRQALVLYVRKLFYFWWRSPYTGLRYPAAWSMAYHVWYVGFLVFVAIGLRAIATAHERARAVGGLLILLGACFSLGQSVFYIGGRHRWTIEAILGLFAAAGACRLWENIRGQPSHQTVEASRA